LVRGVQLLFHQVDLSFDCAQRVPQQENLKSADYCEQTSESQIGPVRPILRYQHGREFTDRYGLLCLFGTWAFCIIAAWPIAVIWDRH
jgi:hypothetical protein